LSYIIYHISCNLEKVIEDHADEGEAWHEDVGALGGEVDAGCVGDVEAGVACGADGGVGAGGTVGYASSAAWLSGEEIARCATNARGGGVGNKAVGGGEGTHNASAELGQVT